jgi:Cu2+-exporting ATPase
VTASAEAGLFLDGLRCAGCVNRVERELRSVPGVVEASVSYTTHRALVRFDPARVGPDDLVARVAALGYAASPYDPEALERPARASARDALVRVLVAGFLAANVMWLSAALYIGSYEGIDEATRRALRWLVVVLSFPAVTWCALPFWRGALAGLRRLELRFDLPVVLGISTAFAASVAGTLAETRHLFADSAATIVFLILLGRTLERSASAKAAGAVGRLVALTPASALRLGPGGAERVDPRELRAGDRVLVPAGQTVPADGTLVGPATELDESLLTGESSPVLREPGAAVVGGTRNLLAEAEVVVTAPVGAGTLARLAALLERAQAERPRVQRLADRVAAVFAPAVLLAAAATAAAWAWLGAPPLEVALTAAAVLIVACPCALGLATPAAVTAAIGRAASLGILVKSGEALERCAEVDEIVLDKTGTLTEGAHRVEALATGDGVSGAELLARAAAAEGGSTHPVAAAIRAAAGAGELPELPRRTLPGRGVEAGALRVGSLAFLREAGLEPTPALRAEAEALAARGLTLAWVAEGARVLGAVGLADAPRADAAQAVARLRRLGLGVALVSGDHARAVAHAAARAGIPDASAGVAPAGKVLRVRAARSGGARVLVAGDGVNDAAALGAADVGVAMARGADVTIHAADVVIRSPRLGALADLVALARVALRRVRQNLGIAVAYNAVAVPLAALGFLEPLPAALAMSLSSLVVVGNSIRLLRWEAAA